jgi:uncharacterized protein (DUF58 family)
MAESLLDPTFLAQLEYLYVVTRELFVGHTAADRMSRKFGVGMQFADYRAYTAGDDYRYIDWAAYARRDDLLIKLFTEEQSNHLYFAIDASRSMATGSPQKLFYAKKIAAALAYIGLANLDPVTVVSFDDQLRDESRIFQGRGKVSQMVSHLDGIQPAGKGTGLARAMQEFFRRRPARGVLVLLSDFFDREGYEETIRLVHYERFDVIAVQVNERSELEPSLDGDVELVDSETGAQTTVRPTPELIEEYKRRITEHYGELAHLCKRLRRRHLPVLTDVPFESVIFDVFRRGGLVK